MPKSKRKFYKTVIKVELLSEEQIVEEFSSLHDVAAAMDEGDCSGTWNTVSSLEIGAKRAARELQAQGSDPEFFQLTEDGEDL